MKKTMKKLISVFVSICLLVSTVALIGSGADSSKHTGSDIPVIYVEGTGFHLYKDNGDGTTTKVFPLELSDEKITALVEENIDVFAEAFFTQEWGEFCDVLYSIMTDLYGEVILDENGESPNGVYSPWTWDPATLGDRRNQYGNYDIQTYSFHYDWRKDPYQTADMLHRYIEDVMAATGASEVALLGRCLGANITAAYMDKYNAEHISDYIIYAGAQNGADLISKLFSGKIHLAADGVERFVYDKNLLGEGTLYNDLLNAFVTVLNTTYGLDIACWAVNNVYDDIYLDIMPRLMKDTVGTFPGYWSMVSTEDYDQAKEVIFHGADKEKYANFINIIDNYHYNVTAEIEEDLLRYAEMGVDIFNVTKYGYQAIPIADETYNSALSDNTVCVTKASNGATTMPVGETFSKKYIESSIINGTFSYISPDKQIDASTALFPDRTWFIKGMRHDVFPDEMDKFFGEMIRNEGYTIHSDSDYPQYMIFDSETKGISPLTFENKDTESWSSVTFFEALKKLFLSINELIMQALAQKIQGNA